MLYRISRKSSPYAHMPIDMLIYKMSQYQDTYIRFPHISRVERKQAKLIAKELTFRRDNESKAEAATYV